MTEANLGGGSEGLQKIAFTPNPPAPLDPIDLSSFAAPQKSGFESTFNTNFNLGGG